MNTSPNDFVLWYDALMQLAPDGYIPWLFPVKENGKDPDALAIGIRAGNISPCCKAEWLKVQRGKFPKTICSNCGQGKGSWKASWARLTKQEAIQRLQQGKNIGIAARKNDALAIIDQDTPDAEAPAKETLTCISRRRNGKHYFFFTTDPRCKQTIPTEHLGELRSADAYVVSAGSYCAIDEEQLALLPEEEKPFAGKYTCSKPIPANTITWELLPKHFIEVAEKFKQHENYERKDFVATRKGKASALFSLKMSDLVVNHSPRFPHPLHGSERTGANFSISDDGNFANCWRHNCSLNAIHFLAVKSGKFSCEQVGKQHKGSSIPITPEVIFWAWHEGKKSGVLPIDDPIPGTALNYIADKHGVCKTSKGKLLPRWAFERCLKIVEADY